MSEGENYPITWIKKATINILDTDVALKRIIKFNVALILLRLFFLALIFLCSLIRFHGIFKT